MSTPTSDTKPASATKMVNPPQNPRMTAPPGTAAKPEETAAAPAKVKIRALRAISIDNKIVQPGAEIEVTAEDAVEFCDKSFDGLYEHDGETSTRNAKFATIVRAVRV